MIEPNFKYMGIEDVQKLADEFKSTPKKEYTEPRTETGYSRVLVGGPCSFDRDGPSGEPDPASKYSVTVGGWGENIHYSLLRDDLRAIYVRNQDRKARRIAGEALGFCNPRIWAHEHPVSATLTGIAFAGSASGLVYALVEYFSK